MKCRDLLIRLQGGSHIEASAGRKLGQRARGRIDFLNQQINYWAARACYAYTTTFQVHSLTPGHQPHQIGPGFTAPDFAAPIRPVDIESAAVILSGPTPVDVPIRLRDRAWWAANQVKTLQSTFPTNLYYEPDYPNGQLWFWPIANAAHSVRIRQRDAAAVRHVGRFVCRAPGVPGRGDSHPGRRVVRPVGGPDPREPSATSHKGAGRSTEP